ncbi:MAG TPA: VOC family protein [Rhizomicrobium sp.]|jgi:predicted enzyme related to lactoylglutathione lyase|nr:VOC family protein [Rhizomicrobium sp.]
MAQITGIGGVFIKSRDPKALSAWYRDKLGLAVEDWGGALLRRTAQSPHTATWTPFANDAEHFAPSTREVMINFAVDDLDEFVKQIEARGVKIEGRMADEAYGEFAWVIDPDGTKLEFWQPAKG